MRFLVNAAGVEVYRNYQNALNRAGFTELVAGYSERTNSEIGGRGWLGVAYRPRRRPFK